MILARTKVIGFPRVFAFFMLGPLIGITYALYAVVFWLINKGVPRPLVFFPIGLIFAVVNIAHNAVVCSILFWELPREWFTTDRLKRWKRAQNDTARRELADLLGGFLNRHDQGHY